MTYEPPSDRDPVPRFIGWGLIAVSVIWIAVAGACAVFGLSSGPEGFIVGVIGVVCIAAGVAIFFLGRMLARN